MYSHPLGVELHSLHLLPVPPSDREKEAFFRFQLRNQFPKSFSGVEISPKNTPEIALLNCSKNEQRKLAVLVPLQVSLRDKTFSPKND